MAFWLLEHLSSSFRGRNAIIWKGKRFSYDQLLDAVAEWQERLRTIPVEPGECVAIIGDYSPNTISLFLALAANQNIIVPLTVSAAKNPDFFDIARVSAVFSFEEEDQWRFTRREVSDSHPLLTQLREEKEPGVVIFTSGSTGTSKAALHNLNRLVERSAKQSRSYTTLVFLLWDHIGGQNTLLRLLAVGGEIVFLEDRDPDSVCSAIERFGVELLPTSPTFLNMLLISGAYQRYDLSSLKLITYGTEPMPPSTLRGLRQALPEVKLKQTYGLSELGILKTRSKSSDSLWLKLGGEGFESKVVDGVLWLKIRSAMLGYLNAPSPFTEDGWYNTGDAVEVDGEYFRFLGRKSEVINVGGEKVYPAEVESVLLEMEGVLDAAVRGVANPITGQVVGATLRLREPEEPRALLRRVREFCQGRLAPYKIPAIVRVSDAPQHDERFKKMRKASSSR